MSPPPFGQVRRLGVARLDQRLPPGRGPRGAPAGLVAVADHQTAGRGRLGRRWEAPPGSSLLVSVLLRPVLSADLHLCTAAVALATASACADRGRRRAAAQVAERPADRRSASSPACSPRPTPPRPAGRRDRWPWSSASAQRRLAGPPDAGGTRLVDAARRPVDREQSARRAPHAPWAPARRARPRPTGRRGSPTSCAALRDARAAGPGRAGRRVVRGRRSISTGRPAGRRDGGGHPGRPGGRRRPPAARIGRPRAPAAGDLAGWPAEEPAKLSALCACS